MEIDCIVFILNLLHSKRKCRTVGEIEAGEQGVRWRETMMEGMLRKVKTVREN